MLDFSIRANTKGHEAYTRKHESILLNLIYIGCFIAICKAARTLAAKIASFLVHLIVYVSYRQI